MEILYSEENQLVNSDSANLNLTFRFTLSKYLIKKANTIIITFFIIY